MVLLATSPGPGGAQSVLASAKTSAPYFGGEVLADLSVPSFYDAFDAERNELNDSALKQRLVDAVKTLATPR
jgi:NAD(P)H-dependent FMN reductase